MSTKFDDGLCEQCGELNNGSTFSPFCSEACEEEGTRYFCTYGYGPALPDEKDDQGHCSECQEALAVTQSARIKRLERAFHEYERPHA